MRRVRLLVWPAGAVLGIAAESHLYGLGDTRHWIPDAAVGWTLIVAGAVAWWRQPRSRAGRLLIAAGGAWFAGNFAARLVYLHRAVLIQLVLAHPTGRLRGRLLGVVVAGGYVVSLVPSVWRSEEASLALSAALVGVATLAYLRAPARERHARLRALRAIAMLALVFAGTALARLLWATDAAANATLAAYQLAVGLLAVGLVVSLLTEPSPGFGLTDLVVELGEGGSGTLRGALASALGDPSLEIGFEVAAGRYVDDSGRRLELPGAATGRRVTPVVLPGGRSAVLLHDASVLDDPAVVEAVDAATRMGAANARLQAEVRAQLAEVHASRRRLVRAGDEQRQRLEERLREGAERRLTELRGALELAGGDSGRPAGDGAAVQLARAAAQLDETLAELRDLAGGLHPRALSTGGLPAALRGLVERCSLPVELTVPQRRFAADVEAAAYFVCSEGLTNVVKYANASRATMSVTAVDGRLAIEVTDDGVGGAAAERGSGLRGLADRVEALGGELALDSPPGAGTRLAAGLPLT